MKINVESFVSLTAMLNDFAAVKEKIEKLGEVIVCHDDMPLYRLTRIDSVEKGKRMTLVKAIEAVLSEAEGHVMHVNEITKRINEQGLYRMKNGGNVSAVQVRAHASLDSAHFTCLKGNFLKLN